MPKISNTPIKAPILGKKSEIPPPPPPFCFIQDNYFKYFGNTKKYETAFDTQTKQNATVSLYILLGSTPLVEPKYNTCLNLMSYSVLNLKYTKNRT